MVDRGRQHCRLSGLSRGEISTKLMDPNNYMKQDFFFENLEFKWVTCPCALGPPLGLSRDGLDTSVCIAVYIDEPCISSKDKHEEQQSESYLVQVLENGFLMNECKWTTACAVFHVRGFFICSVARLHFPTGVGDFTGSDLITCLPQIHLQTPGALGITCKRANGER
jgi:hypothetical protein